MNDRYDSDEVVLHTGKTDQIVTVENAGETPDVPATPSYGNHNRRQDASFTNLENPLATPRDFRIVVAVFIAFLATYTDYSLTGLIWTGVLIAIGWSVAFTSPSVRTHHQPDNETVLSDAGKAGYALTSALSTDASGSHSLDDWKIAGALAGVAAVFLLTLSLVLRHFSNWMPVSVIVIIVAVILVHRWL